MEFVDDQSPQSPKKNIADEIKSLRNDIQEDNDKIMRYTDYMTNPNRNNQNDFEEYLDMIEFLEKQRNENLELLKSKIQELINHPLNTIDPPSKKREREPSQSGGTKKNRRKNKRKNKNKRKRTMRR